MAEKILYICSHSLPCRAKGNVPAMCEHMLTHYLSCVAGDACAVNKFKCSQIDDTEVVCVPWKGGDDG